MKNYKLYGNSRRRPEERRTERAEGIPEQPVELSSVSKEISSFFEQLDAEEQNIAPMQMEPHVDGNEPEQPEAPEEAQAAKSARTRAWVLLACSICAFVFSVSLSLLLINKSAQAAGLGSGNHGKQLEYVVNALPSVTVEVPEDVKVQAPVSANQSDSIISVLLIAQNEKTKTTDSLILLSINLREKSCALLSFPRDIYVSGAYETPKLSSVYAAVDNGKERGNKALVEKVKDMLGFWPDYYFAFDSATLDVLLEQAGGVEVELPESMEYCNLSGGTQSFTAGAKAIELFHFRSDYTEIDPEATEPQRLFVKALLKKLLALDSKALAQNAESLCSAARTDLGPEELAYLALLLRNTDLNDSFSVVLPGEEITVKDESYFEVDPEEAVVLLNEHFNPLESELDVYDVNFRQKTGSSTDGEGWDPFGFPTKKTEPTEDSSTDETENSSTDPTEDSSTDPTDNSSSDPTDNSSLDPTDPPSSEQTEPPAPSESGQKPTDPPSTDSQNPNA